MQRLYVRRTVINHAVVELHDALVALLPGHQLGDHGAILIIDGRLVGVWPTHRLATSIVVHLQVASCLVRSLDLWQRQVLMPSVIVWPNLTLHVVIG